MVGCPYDALSEDIDEMTLVAHLFKRGTMPAPGGYLDQVNKVILACRMIWCEQSEWRNEAMKGK